MLGLNALATDPRFLWLRWSDPPASVLQILSNNNEIMETPLQVLKCGNF